MEEWFNDGAGDDGDPFAGDLLGQPEDEFDGLADAPADGLDDAEPLPGSLATELIALASRLSDPVVRLRLEMLAGRLAHEEVDDRAATSPRSWSARH
jgi:hypothetical protein